MDVGMRQGVAVGKCKPGNVQGLWDYLHQQRAHDLHGGVQLGNDYLGNAHL